MPYYYKLRNMTPADRTRTLDGLDRLRAQLDAEMPAKTRDATLVLGTWNIRNFDDNRFMNGARTTEDLYYLAEIIARFDVIAVQEICNDLGPLDDLMRLLGGDFRYIVTDLTEGSGGNGERLGFIYDRSKVSFKGVAGELVLPDNLLIKDGTNALQFARTPFMCAFQSGWFKFMFSTVHIYFGSDSGQKYRRRVAEIAAVAKFLAKRAKKDDRNHVLVGDFNIVKPGSDGDNALKDAGFEVFMNGVGSNKDQTKFYDQISFRTRDGELRFTGSPREKGVLQFFDSLYREQDFPAYQAALEQAVAAKIAKIETEKADNALKLAKTTSASRKATLTKMIVAQDAALSDWAEHLTDAAKLKDYYLSEWRTFHGSDRLPLWVELEIDFSDTYLDGLRKL